MLIKSINNCLKDNNFEIFYLDTTTSTMDVAKSLIDKTSNNFIILANKQTKGRGRRGNLWVSDYGNIYCSIVLSNYISLNEFFKFNMLTSVSIKDSLEHVGINNIYFKWPNDIYVKQKKLAGILQETFINNVKKKYLIIGIGINFQSSPNINNYKTTYISKYVNNINIKDYFEIFINYFLFYFNEYIISNNKDFILKYKNLQMFLHDQIKIMVNEKKILKGTFMGINDDGSLILQQEKNSVFIYSGQIIL